MDVKGIEFQLPTGIRCEYGYCVPVRAPPQRCAPVTRDFELSSDGLFTRLRSSLSGLWCMRVPQSDYTFHFTVALKATYTQGPGNPPCLRDSRFQAGVVIPQQSSTRFMIPPTGSSIPLNIGGSVSW